MAAHPSTLTLYSLTGIHRSGLIMQYWKPNVRPLTGDFLPLWWWWCGGLAVVQREEEDERMMEDVKEKGTHACTDTVAMACQNIPTCTCTDGNMNTNAHCLFVSFYVSFLSHYSLGIKLPNSKYVSVLFFSTGFTSNRREIQKPRLPHWQPNVSRKHRWLYCHLYFILYIF